jgi:hypothetical protein
MKIAGLSNAELLQEVERLVAVERTATARVIAAIAEIDVRRLYLEQGFSHYGGDKRQPESEAHLHVIRGAPEPEDADAYSPVYPTDECVQQEDREPHRSRGTALHVLELLPRASDAARDASDGSGHLVARLEACGGVGLLDAAEKKAA